MDFKQIQDLIKLVSKSELTELTVKQENFKIVLKKSNGAVNPPIIQSGGIIEKPILISSTPAAPQTTPSPVETKNEDSSDTQDDKYVVINSPMIGTFYRSSSPEKGPFVKIGDVVSKGDHICIIEAMKLFNEIEAEISGKIMKVLAEDSSPVEYDQPLFLIDPTGV